MTSIPAASLSKIRERLKQEGFHDDTADLHAEHTTQVVRLATQDLVGHEDFSVDDFMLIRNLSLWRGKCTQQRKETLIRESRMHEKTKKAILRLVAQGTVGCWGTGKITMHPREKDLRKLRALFTLLLDPSVSKNDIDVFIKENDLQDMKDVGIGTLSTLMHCLRPTEYAVVNGGVKDGLEGFFGRRIRMDTAHYPEENDALIAFRDANGLPRNLRSIDKLFYFDEFLELLPGNDAMEKIISGFLEEYVRLRSAQGYEQEEWNEAYKWRILPEVHALVFTEDITPEKVARTVEILKAKNPQQGSFADLASTPFLRHIARNEESCRFIA